MASPITSPEFEEKDLSVGVVVPTFNRANLIRETLDSILSQSFRPQKIVVIDDGSTDHTKAVLGEYGDDIIVKKIVNSGDMAARNVGISLLDTRLVAFCDSDDVWNRDFLSSMISLWKTAPEIKVAYSDFVVINGGVWGKKSKMSSAPDGFWKGFQSVGPDSGVFTSGIVERLLSFQPFFPSCMVVDRIFFHHGLGGWDEGVSRIVGCDFATALLVAEYAKIGVIRRPLVGIRKHDKNISSDVQKMNLGDAKVLEYVLNTRSSLASFAPAFRRSIIKRRQDALHTAFARNDLKSVREIYNLLPNYARGGSIALKRSISNLSPPIGRTLASLLVGAGTIKSNIIGKN